MRTTLGMDRRTVLAAAVLAASLALPGRASAQARLEPVRVTAVRVAEANALDLEAVALYGSPKTWRKAAGLHKRAANMRAVSDERGHHALRMAAHLYRAAGDLNGAVDAMERAAEHAAQRGDVQAAATDYVDAGFLAIESRRSDRVPAFAMRAELLAGSPLLTEEQRATIKGRIGYSQVVATIQR